MTTLRHMVLASAAALLLVACGGDEKPQAGVIELNSLFEADFALTDFNGDAVTDEDFEGKPMLIYYGFTACPDVCPAALGAMGATLDQLGAKASDVHPVFITVDPERDTPDRLRNHLAFDERIIGLTGTPAAIDAARDGLHVYAKKVPLPDSAMEYTVDHQRLFYITDKNGTPVKAIPDSVSPEVIAAILADLL